MCPCATGRMQHLPAVLRPPWNAAATEQVAVQAQDAQHRASSPAAHAHRSALSQVCRKEHGLADMTFLKSMRGAAGVLLNGDLALFPAQPVSPHLHTVRSL